MRRSRTCENLRGIFPPVVTPYDRHSKLDEKGFVENIKKYRGTGIGGVVVAGSTGEAPYLTEQERLRLVALARDMIHPPELLIAGAGLESTQATIRLSREAIQLGADALLILTPNYYKPCMGTVSQLAHYRAVADSLTRPVIIYSIPQFTGVHLEIATIAALSHHPNIIGLKESSGDIRFVRAILRGTRPGFRVLAGSVTILLDALRAGAVGGVLGQANFAPDLCVGVYQAFEQREWKRAAELLKKIEPLVRDISTPYGVSGVKAAMDLCGYCGGSPRLPLLPLNPSERRRVKAALDECRAATS